MVVLGSYGTFFLAQRSLSHTRTEASFSSSVWRLPMMKMASSMASTSSYASASSPSPPSSSLASNSSSSHSSSVSSSSSSEKMYDWSPMSETFAPEGRGDGTGAGQGLGSPLDVLLVIGVEDDPRLVLDDPDVELSAGAPLRVLRRSM